MTQDPLPNCGHGVKLTFNYQAESRLVYTSNKAATMPVFAYGRRKAEHLSYRDYDLEILKDQLGWRLGVHPSRPDLPVLARSKFLVTYPRKDDALCAAYTRIDLLLA